MSPSSPLENGLSSAELFAPDNVRVRLSNCWTDDTNWPGTETWYRGNGGRLHITHGELDECGLNDKFSSLQWYVDDELSDGETYWVP